jgi:hypothetical protein
MVSTLLKLNMRPKNQEAKNDKNRIFNLFINHKKISLFLPYPSYNLHNSQGPFSSNHFDSRTSLFQSFASFLNRQFKF